jgi:uncharacterized membrane protein
MLWLLLAAAVFVGFHLLIAGTRLRDRLIAQLGPQRYRVQFSLASVAGLVWLCLTYNDAPRVALWGGFPGCRIVALAGMAIAVVLAVLGLTTSSPTAVGGEGALARGPVGLQSITRHPFLWGVALWGALHVMANGDGASLVLFGSLGLLALLGTASIDRKRRRTLGPAWDGFAAVTSNLPFVALAQGRARLRLGEHKAWQWLAAAAAFAALLAAHRALFGVSPLPHIAG